MLYSFDQIRTAVLAAQADQGPLMVRMRDILIRYEGDYVIPLPSMNDEPKVPAMTPALIGEAIDQIALRASSIAPTIMCPALDPRKDTGKRSKEYGYRRSQIIKATYETSRWSLGRRRYYRHLTAYHTAAMVVVPDMHMKLPRIEVRDPLGSYCEPQASESLRDPMWCAFVNRYSGSWLRKMYPICAQEMGGPITNQDTRMLWDVVEWYDHDDIVVGLIGPCDPYGIHINTNTTWMGNASAPMALELSRLPNRADCLPACMPHNVSLGRIASRIGAMLGNVDMQGKLMALNIIAQEKAIFPDVYAIGRANGEPTI